MSKLTDADIMDFGTEYNRLRDLGMSVEEASQYVDMRMLAVLASQGGQGGEQGTDGAGHGDHADDVRRHDATGGGAR